MPSLGGGAGTLEDALGLSALYKKLGKAVVITLPLARPNLGRGLREYLLLPCKLHGWFAAFPDW